MSQDSARRFAREFLRANLLQVEFDVPDDDVPFNIEDLNFAWFELAGAVVHYAQRQTGRPLPALLRDALDEHDLGRRMYGGADPD